MIAGDDATRGAAGLPPNRRFVLDAQRAHAHRSRIASEWMDFIDHHISPAFVDAVLAVFAAAIRQTHPRIEARVGRPIEDWRDAVTMDCRVGIDTPPAQVASVRGPEVDPAQVLFTGMLFFRHPDDTAGGGDLQIHRWRRPGSARFEQGAVVERDTELVATIPYRANSFVLMLNSAATLHSVSARAPSAQAARVVHFSGDFTRPLHQGLFDKPEKSAQGLRRFTRGLMGQR
jgi:hypothetical protein